MSCRGCPAIDKAIEMIEQGMKPDAVVERFLGMTTEPVLGISGAHRSIEEAIEDDPEKWGKFWRTLVGDVEHKRTKCIEKLGDKLGDIPGGSSPERFCQALYSRFEK